MKSYARCFRRLNFHRFGPIEILFSLTAITKLGITELTNQTEGMIKLFEQETPNLENRRLQEKIAQILLCDTADNQ
ncbi:hypothetical protein PT285_09790 [Lactobacillus sp. ESL0791]|uniref:hypothetical protein n=1 Tax=Lactobacillus sp. ESL0791 TaxID=2983234 RepID=UPI0023F9B2ED|nr:hypothetical protein [Lactobacillus sp. ESL0791]MDF7639691.1 hypothetical protein [Lactobacillus sp. ESL0791]